MLNTKTIDQLLHTEEIYPEPEVRDYAYGLAILAKYPNAKIVEVPSHWKIPELHGNHDAVKDWIK